jgi:hypothetical protein
MRRVAVRISTRGARRSLSPKPLNESSTYYLLVWRPDSENQKSGKSRLNIAVKGHPDLRVRMRRTLL